MFEKEALYYGFHQTLGIGYDKMKQSAYDWQNGAEFGYNKANEWHYPSKGEYPKENKRYFCKIKAFVGGGTSYECFDYDIEYGSWKDACGDVIAWKEIVPPKE